MTPDISIIIPVIRPDKAARCVAALTSGCVGLASGMLNRWYIDGWECEIIATEDTKGVGAPDMVARLTDEATASRVLFLGDDTVPEPRMVAAAMAAMATLPDGWGLVALNDGVWNGVQATHWLADKRLLDHLPDRRFFSHAYQHGYCDAELSDICRDLGRYTYAPEARLFHDHPQVTGAEPDEHYSRIYRADVLDADRRTYWRRKRGRMGFNVGIGLPLQGTQRDDDFWISFINMDKPDVTAIYVPVFPVSEFRRDIAILRENLVPQALDDGVSHLVMTDTDQVYPPDTLVKLCAHARQGKRIVGGVVHRRYPPFDALLQRGTPHAYTAVPDAEKYSGDLVEIDATGTGCIMIDTSVFIDMPRPWFDLPQDGELAGFGEDIAFCARARAAGITIWADTSIEIDHIARARVNRAFYEMFKRNGRASHGATPNNDKEVNANGRNNHPGRAL
jgi:GT2 family glycosyltransferase